MKINHDSWWAMHEAMVSDLQSKKFSLEDSVRNPKLFVIGTAIETVFAAGEMPTSDPIAWKRDAITLSLNHPEAKKRKCEIFAGAQIGAVFAKQYITENPEVMEQLEIAA
jgi:hypothetical protein